MEDIQYKLDNIRSVVRAFKAEQENLILKGNDSLNKNSLAARRASGQHVKKVIQPMSKDGSTKPINVDEQSILQVLNVDVLIMPIARDSGEQQLWPQALAARFGLATVGIVNIENHGTLWKLVPRQDSFAGHRVYLQSSVSGQWLLAGIS